MTPAKINECNLLDQKERRREMSRMNAERWRKNNPQKFKQIQDKFKSRISSTYWHDIKMKSKYGIEPHEYYEMLEKQNNVCAICFKSETRIHRCGKIDPLGIDHNHKTGKIRGLLCFSCNTAIGKFKDDINLLTNAINYLKKEI